MFTLDGSSSPQVRGKTQKCLFENYPDIFTNLLAGSHDYPFIDFTRFQERKRLIRQVLVSKAAG